MGAVDCYIHRHDEQQIGVLLKGMCLLGHRRSLGLAARGYEKYVSVSQRKNLLVLSCSSLTRGFGYFREHYERCLGRDMPYKAAVRLKRGKLLPGRIIGTPPNCLVNLKMTTSRVLVTNAIDVIAQANLLHGLMLSSNIQ
jgi:hypothetical protein